MIVALFNWEGTLILVINIMISNMEYETVHSMHLPIHYRTRSHFVKMMIDAKFISFLKYFFSILFVFHIIIPG